jgi:SAM-dependent methyltransferase
MSHDPTHDEIAAAHAAYTRRSLRGYDLLVHGLSNHVLWRCPTRELLAHYDAHVSANHLDVGVGTGYFLDRCRFPTARPRLALMDLNPECLRAAASRVARYRPEVYQYNVLEPIELAAAPFDSIGLMYLLHCLPGALADKARVFDNVAAHLRPGGVLFGATLLQGDAPRGFLAQRLMDFYNAKGIFNNARDDRATLERALRERFARSEVRLVGCVALFVAYKAG